MVSRLCVAFVVVVVVVADFVNVVVFEVVADFVIVAIIVVVAVAAAAVAVAVSVVFPWVNTKQNSDTFDESF